MPVFSTRVAHDEDPPACAERELSFGDGPIGLSFDGFFRIEAVAEGSQAAERGVVVGEAIARVLLRRLPEDPRLRLHHRDAHLRVAGRRAVPWDQFLELVAWDQVESL